MIYMYIAYISYLTGEKVEVAWAEFSTLSWAVLLDNIIHNAHGHF
jgi:hypothetical protein